MIKWPKYHFLFFFSILFSSLFFLYFILSSLSLASLSSRQKRCRSFFFILSSSIVVLSPPDQKVASSPLSLLDPRWQLRRASLSTRAVCAPCRCASILPTGAHGPRCSPAHTSAASPGELALHLHLAAASALRLTIAPTRPCPPAPGQKSPGPRVVRGSGRERLILASPYVCRMSQQKLRSYVGGAPPFFTVWLRELKNSSPSCARIHTKRPLQFHSIKMAGGLIS